MISLGILAQIRNLLGAAITTIPTPGSLRDILHRDDLLTYDRSTDSLEAISDAIAAQAGKLGLVGPPRFSDYFLGVAHEAAPDSSLWALTDGGGQLLVYHGAYVGGGAGNAALRINDTTGSEARVVSNRYFDIAKGGSTQLIFETVVSLDSDESTYCGLYDSSLTPNVANADTGSANRAIIIRNASGMYLVTGDGNTYTATDISTHYAANTWLSVRIVLTATQVICYIDGTLAATHDTNIPTRTLQAVLAARKLGSSNITSNFQFANIWNE